MKVLIVKTSSLGDIIQSLNTAKYLKNKFKDIEIHWVIEKEYFPLISTYPYIDGAIIFDMKFYKKNFLSYSAWKQFFIFLKNLRKNRYDLLFDMQGNIKSSIVNFFAISQKKIGFGYNSVREWPNIFSTNFHINIETNINMGLQYTSLIKNYFQDKNYFDSKKVLLKISDIEILKISQILEHKNLQTTFKMMICPHSIWENKKMDIKALISFLNLIKKSFDFSFLIIYGNENEKIFSDKIYENFKNSSLVIEKLNIPSWQNLMNRVDLVFSMDSAALHLC
ncbi:MAG: hypothetical protein A3F40_01355, partial [Chlamydiae bacterium RIFCSPHIGHO2_12_FULL_27_8]